VSNQREDLQTNSAGNANTLERVRKSMNASIPPTWKCSRTISRDLLSIPDQCEDGVNNDREVRSVMEDGKP